MQLNALGHCLPQAAPPSGVAAAAPGPLVSPFGTATWFLLTDKGMGRLHLICTDNLQCLLIRTHFSTVLTLTRVTWQAPVRLQYRTMSC